MTRKPGRMPAHLAKADRQSMWEVIRANADSFTIHLVGDTCRAHARSVQHYVDALVAGGYVARLDEGIAGERRHKLIRDEGYHAPRLRADGTPCTVGSGYENMWRSMCMLVQFTPEEVAAMSTTSTVDVPVLRVRPYLSRLLSCGYLRVVKKANSTKGQSAVYRLVRNSGPRPPQIQRVQQVFDPNNGEVYQLKGTQT